MGRDWQGSGDERIASVRDVLLLAMLGAAIVAGLIAYANWRHTGDPIPSHSPSVRATVSLSPQGHTPVCQGPLQGQCWESEDDGDPATMWREYPRAMMLPQSKVDRLTAEDPSRDWSACWQYLSRLVIECPDGALYEG